ncbi:MAG: phosphorylase [Chloroflexus sp.]|uniref:nucleoside phosphorylase n=1 Tax=Chloroflexus sp. TaxID=1904827 RepID=UPI0021DE6AA2|nr:nucleoside phosphorylase [Chloroflexus sp.]GIV89979.1 MAG: phosphorylase [Chloroflexus sp.]
MTYPILEYDPSPTAVIEPTAVIKPRDVPEHCVICFFREVIERVVVEQRAVQIAELRWEDGPHPVFAITHREQRIAFLHPGVGAPIAAGLLEEVIALGCRKFIACGGCGVLDRNIAVGGLIIVTAAVRDEGVSYHYLPPSREIEADAVGLQALVQTLEHERIPYRCGKTWTTDAPYRETVQKVERRRAEGCIAVEMEAAGMMAVARFRGVAFGQMLYGGDDISGLTRDSRAAQSRAAIRERIFWLSADACLRI